jgi:hypothetical protein
MKSRTRKTSWFVAGLFLLALVSAGFELVVAQTKSETSGPPLDTSAATFEMLGENKLINMNNIAYMADEARMFDVFFTCSSVRGTDPLRFMDPKDVSRAKEYFNDDKRYGRQFLKFNKYCISVRNIAYIESKGDSLIIRFNARVMDSFVQLALSGADAESFKKKMQEFYGNSSTIPPTF